MDQASKQFHKLIDNLQFQVNHEMAMNIIKRLPYELQDEIWRQVIFSTLDSHQLIELIGPDRLLDLIIIQGLIYCQFEIHGGLLIIKPRKKDRLTPRSIPMMDYRKSSILILSDEAIKLANFMIRNGVKSKTLTSSSIFPQHFDNIKGYSFTKFLNECFEEVRIINGQSSEVSTTLEFYACATTLELRCSKTGHRYKEFDCMLPQLPKLKTLILSLASFDDVYDVTLDMDGLEKWCRLPSYDNTRKQVVVTCWSFGWYQKGQIGKLCSLLPLFRCYDIDFKLSIELSEHKSKFELPREMYKHLFNLGYSFVRSAHTEDINWISNCSNIRTISLEHPEKANGLLIPNSIPVETLNLKQLRSEFSNSIKNFSNLKILDLRNCDVYASFCDNIPESVEILKLAICRFHHDTIKLPKCIRYLRIETFDSLATLSNYMFLENLVSIEIYYRHMYTFTSDLNFIGNLGYFIKQLPPNLLSFQLSSHISSVPLFGDLNKEFESHLNTVNFNKLTNLEILKYKGSLFNLGEFDLGKLPPNLKYLEVESKSANFLHSFPSSLRYINLEIGNWKYHSTET